jgi:hypothetical protein
MAVRMSKPVIWTALLLVKAACMPAWAEAPEESLIGCWSAAYEYDSLHGDDSANGGARLCSRAPGAGACGNGSHLAVTYCFDKGGRAYGSETHCWSAKGRGICHGSDGLSGSYRLQGNRMNFFRAAEEGEKDDAQELAWSCSFSISGHPGVLEFSDCAQAMRTFFRDCDFGQKFEEYRTDNCGPNAR